jgi:hypothetical protein
MILSPVYLFPLFIVAVIFVCFVPAGSFFIQFWALYCACRARSGIRHLIALFVWGFGFLFNLLMAAGIPYIGGW